MYRDSEEQQYIHQILTEAEKKYEILNNKINYHCNKMVA
jgi:hypothetical protein